MNTTKLHCPRGRAFLPTATVALLALTGLAEASPRFVMKIADHDGTALIAGEAAEPHKDWIEVLCFGSSIETPAPEEGSTIRPTPVQTDFVVHKPVDKSTPLLQEACFSGLLLPAVQFKYLGETGSSTTGSEPVMIELRHVQVVGYHMNIGGSVISDVIPTEEVALNFSEASWIYRERNEHDDVIGEVTTTLLSFLGTEDPAFDDDGDGLTNDLDNDDDNDGITDHNEAETGSNPFMDDADLDLDGDGQTTRDEAVAGTRSDNGADFFGIDRITHRRTPRGPECVVSLPTKGGRQYRLLASMDPRMPKEAWMVLDEFESPPGAPETIADIELNAAILQNASQLFFRAEVKLMAAPEPGPDPLDPVLPPLDPVLPPLDPAFP